MTAARGMQFELADEAATERLAGWLAAYARAGDVLALFGDLGTGKTVFARAFIRALGGGEEVPSPTFTLLQTYETRSGSVYHFDLFRLEAAEEAFELGVEEAFAEGISLIEWPARLGVLLPRRRLALAFDFGAAETTRRVILECPEGEDDRDDWSERLADAEFTG